VGNWWTGKNVSSLPVAFLKDHPVEMGSLWRAMIALQAGDAGVASSFQRKAIRRNSLVEDEIHFHFDSEILQFTCHRMQNASRGRGRGSASPPG